MPPLAGIRVVELARILAGPWAGQLLADLGADVIKVERPGVGDDTRSWGPPFLESPAPEPASTPQGGADRGPDAAYFHACNRGKRSIEADFKSAAGRRVVLALAERADILIENYKVGGLASYGLDYESLSRINPRLIYCSITGFGQTGPYADRAGYDFMIQAMGGIMSVTGEPDGQPEKVGVAFADIFTGLYAVAAIQSALIARQRTGRGQHIDMSLLDCQVGVLANQAMNYLVSGNPPTRRGNIHPNIAPYEAFPAADGHFVITAGNDQQFTRLCRLLDLAALATDPRFSSNADRVANRAELSRLIGERTRSRSAAHWLARLEAEGVPAGPINDLAQVFADPQVLARNMRLDLSANGRTVPAVRTPIDMSDTPPVYARPSPRLGEHTREILEELGLEGE